MTLKTDMSTTIINMTKKRCRRRFVLLAFFFLMTSTAFAQKETSNWYFGRNAGISFSSGAPVAVADGKLISYEGCASISDTTGKLLFYTNGSTIWNSRHEVMKGGDSLKGNMDASQSALIVQQYNSPYYYVFTVGGANMHVFGRFGGIAYSIIDIRGDGNKGEVITKNIELLPVTSEKVTGVHHTDGKSVWIMTQHWGSNAKYAWLLHPTGLNMQPVVSSVGYSHDNPVNSNGGAQGYMKFSHDGKKLASIVSFDGYVELFDFDATTGLVSNPQLLPSGGGPYGVEFSPNDSVLYATSWNAEIWQWNIALSDTNEVKASRFLVHKTPFSSGMSRALGIQLAPDNRIYVSIRDRDSVGIIEDPNKLGLLCNFNRNAISLNGNKSLAGLSNFVQSLFKKRNISPGEPPSDGISIIAGPSPSTFTVLINVSGTSYVTERVYNVAGQLLFSRRTAPYMGSFSSSLSLLHHPAGVYFIQVETNIERKTQKVIKVN